MLGISLFEILVVFFVFILALRPEEMVKTAKCIAKLVKKVKRYSSNVLTEIFGEEARDSEDKNTNKIIGMDGKLYDSYHSLDEIKDVIEKQVEYHEKTRKTKARKDK